MTIRKIFIYTFRTITKNWLAFNKNVLKPLDKSVLIPMGLTVVASATDVAVLKKMFGSGTRPLDLAKRTTLLISNEEMKDINKIVKSLEESVLLIKGVSKTIQNEAK